MMIRINLLPVRQVQKRVMGRQTLVLFAALIFGGFVGNWKWYSLRDSVREQGLQKIQKTQQKITELEKVIGEVNNISKRKKELEDKLKVLADLKKGRNGPVRVMDALATAMPKKVWLKEFSEASGGGVHITGNAMSNDDVAEFMRLLQTVVWTPKGMGRLVEQKKDVKTSRVELLTGAGSIEDFSVNEVGYFFTNVDLKVSNQNPDKLIDFDLSASANYTI
jgi:type IV pilus assembly protein PilN